MLGVEERSHEVLVLGVDVLYQGRFDDMIGCVVAIETCPVPLQPIE